MYTGATFDSSGQFYSLQYESLTYLGDSKVIGCLTETTTCVVAKPLVLIITSEIISQIGSYVNSSNYIENVCG